MITIMELSTVFYSCVSLALIGLVWHFGWKEYRVERFRQDLFNLRQTLFDYAASGNFHFEDPVYVGFRNSLNNLIRFAHQVTFLRIVLALKTFGIDYFVENEEQLTPWKTQMEKLPIAQKERLKEIDSDVAMVTLWHMATVSPFFPILIAIVLVIMSLQSASTLIAPLLNRGVTVLEINASLERKATNDPLVGHI